jgi:hypothetical protein
MAGVTKVAPAIAIRGCSEVTPEHWARATAACLVLCRGLAERHHRPVRVSDL